MGPAKFVNILEKVGIRGPKLLFFPKTPPNLDIKMASKYQKWAKTRLFKWSTTGGGILLSKTAV